MEYGYLHSNVLFYIYTSKPGAGCSKLTMSLVNVSLKFQMKIKLCVSLRAVETFKRKMVGQTAVSDNKSSSVTLNELAKKARKIYCNFEFQRRSHTKTEINLNRAQIIKTV